MVFEVLFFFLSIFALGVYLLSRDLTVLAQHWLLQRRMNRLLQGLPGKNIARAETLFGRPTEIVQGSGRRLYVWKAPRFGQLLIITLTTDDSGLVTTTAWQRR